MRIGFNKTGTTLSIMLIGNLYEEATILAAENVFLDKMVINKKMPVKFLE